MKSIQKIIREQFSEKSEIYDLSFTIIYESFHKNSKSKIAFDKWLELYDGIFGYNWDKISANLNPKRQNLLIDTNIEQTLLIYLLHSTFYVFSMVYACSVLDHKGKFSSIKEIKELLYANNILFPKVFVFDWIDDLEFEYALDIIFETIENSQVSNIPNHDILGSIYQSFFSKKLRHAMGEYYTPQWLASLALDSIASDYKGVFIDPACGSGVFINEIIQRKINQNQTLTEIQNTVLGQDISPLAVIMSSINYIQNVRYLSTHEKIIPPIRLTDTILDDNTLPKVDYIISNPPWVSWKHIPKTYREHLIPVAERYNRRSLWS